MNRGVVAGAVVAGFLLVASAGWVLSRPPSPDSQEPRAVQVPKASESKTPVVAGAQAVRVAIPTGRARRTDLKPLQLGDLKNAKEIHRQAVLEIRGKALQPCAPRPRLKGDSVQTHRVEVDYVLQPSGIVEVQLRGVGADRTEQAIDPTFLDCMGSRVQGLVGPAVEGELRHRFVFAYRTSD